ncbi:ral guanine nucleotide dissociation stimulator-like isoform X2 [Oratosquilla oratoria]|uniref:ral guanine nucleotide dissociation stimulator-like isoform X2 n=1 Tax=Oratosquilla oratoria TaxID=337810 RepID=UPI003F75B1A4
MDIEKDLGVIVIDGSNVFLLQRKRKAPTWRLWGEEKCEGAIYTVYLKKVRYHHPSRTIAQESDDDEISHLEWETVRVRFLKAGTLEKLVESLASDTGELESTFVNVFLATYRTFASTRQVLNLILDRYAALDAQTHNNNTPYDSTTYGCSTIPEIFREQHKKALRLTLQVWLDTYPDDFRDPPMFPALHQLLDFAKSHLPDSDLLIKIGYKLDRMKKEEELKGSPMLQRILSCEEIRIHCSSPMTNGDSQPYEFLDIPEKTFAMQLTRMDTVLFKRVVAHQCLGSVWSRRDRGRGDQSSTVTATVDQFNAVSFRVQSTVLVDTQLRPVQRARLVSKWIDTAQELRLLKNFSSLKAIISGLQSNPIYRLKKTWAAVAKEKMELYEELARIFSEDNNQLNQRELLMKEGTAKRAETVGTHDRHLGKAIEKLTINPLAVSFGTIPYLGTFLTDLTMIDTAIPDSVSDGLINFDKKRKEFEVLAQIRLLQGAANAYQFDVDEKFQRWWDQVLVLDDKEAWNLSCQIEPQGSSAPSSAREGRIRKKTQLGHRKNDSIASTSSGSSCSQFFLDNDSINIPASPQDSCSLERKMSTSSSSSSLPSLDVSVNSGGTTASGRTMDKVSLNQQMSTTSSASTTSPYLHPDYYIIKVSIESSAHEIQGVNLYKSIMLSNSERATSVIRSAMAKHGLEDNPEDYTLAQLLPDGEMVLPPTANVYYAINTAHDLNFVLRRRRHGDEKTIIRRNPGKDHRTRKKL